MLCQELRAIHRSAGTQRQGLIFRPDPPNRRSPVPAVNGRNRINAILNSKLSVEAVLTGIPASLASIPVTWAVRFIPVYQPVIPVYRPVWPVYRWFRAVFRRLKNGSPV